MFRSFANLLVLSWESWQKYSSRALMYRELIPDAKFPDVLWCFKIFEEIIKNKNQLKKCIGVNDAIIYLKI